MWHGVAPAPVDGPAPRGAPRTACGVEFLPYSAAGARVALSVSFVYTIRDCSRVPVSSVSHTPCASVHVTDALCAYNAVPSSTLVHLLTAWCVRTCRVCVQNFACNMDIVVFVLWRVEHQVRRHVRQRVCV